MCASVRTPRANGTHDLARVLQMLVSEGADDPGVHVLGDVAVQLLSTLEVQCVFTIVSTAVVPHSFEVCLEDFQGDVIALRRQPLFNHAKVHRVFDDCVIIWHFSTIHRLQEWPHLIFAFSKLLNRHLHEALEVVL